MKPAQPEGFEAWWAEFSAMTPGDRPPLSAVGAVARAAYLAGMERAARMVDRYAPGNGGGSHAAQAAAEDIRAAAAEEGAET